MYMLNNINIISEELVLTIPKISQKISIDKEGLHSNFLEKPELHPESVCPFSIGSVVIQANKQFSGLGEVALMDYLLLSDGEKLKAQYRVVKIEVRDIGVQKIQTQYKKFELVLITPWPLSGLCFSTNFKLIITGEMV